MSGVGKHRLLWTWARTKSPPTRAMILNREIVGGVGALRLNCGIGETIYRKFCLTSSIVRS